MQTQVQIDFQGVAKTATLEASIAEHVARLEQRWGRITACRVIVKGPGGHHRSSGLYDVRIQLALPDGREVNVARTPPADERHADLTFALNDAFKHARRQLQDRVRRAQGQVKRRAEQPIGKVVRIDPSGDFGFLQTRDGQELYFHRNSMLGDGFARLRVGSHVRFAEESGEKGTQASTVRLLGKHALRA
jgi:cold shock CspA family protein